MLTNFDQTNYQKIPQPISSISLNPDSRTKEYNYSFQINSKDSAISIEAQINLSIEENIRQSNYAVAISLINELIARYPDSAINYNNRGLMYFRNNQLSEAINDLTHALKIDPQLDSAYNNRANCHAARGDLMAAVSDYDEALDLNPANLRAWINQGVTFRELQFYDLALENFDIALAVGNSLQERVYGERGRTYHLRGDWNCAVADYQITLKLLSDLPNEKNYQFKVRGWLDELLNPLTSV